MHMTRVTPLPIAGSSDLVFFPPINGHREWREPDGSDYAARFDDPMREPGESALAYCALGERRMAAGRAWEGLRPAE